MLRIKLLIAHTFDKLFWYGTKV